MSGTPIYSEMNIELIVVGKTDSREVETLVAMYTKRVNHYCKFSITTIADVRNTRNMAASRQKQLEGEAIMKLLGEGDYLVLMDERGLQYTSMEYAQWLQKRMLSGVKRLVLVIGGPYGFSEEVYARANQKISLSKMTFSHQIVRAIFAEQLYRAFTILNNEPYHHE